jgi:hypothetical protein
MEKNNKYLQTLLILLNSIFFLYYLILSFYSRPHFDDLSFIWMMKEMSWYDYIKDMYFERSGRFIGYGLNAFIFNSINLINEYRFFPILFGTIGFGFVWAALKYLNINKNLFQYALLAFNLSILTNIDFPVFNWLCAMCYYWLAPLMLLLIALLISDKNGLKEWLLIIMISIFLGGIHEAFAPIVLVALFIIIILSTTKNAFSLKVSTQNLVLKKTITAAILLTLCTIIVVIAPGNYVRLNTWGEISRPDTVFEFILGIGKTFGMLFYFQSFYLPYYLILMVVFMCFGSQQNRIEIKTIKIILLICIAFLIYLILSILPSAYLWGGVGLQRNYTHVIFTISVFTSAIGYILGNKFKDQNFQKKITFLANIGILILISIMIYNVYSDTISSKKYADSIDNRIRTVLELKQKNNYATIQVEPISIPYTTDPKYNLFKLLGKTNAQPILYYISDTDTIPNEYVEHFKLVYGLKFDIVLKHE